MLGGDMLCSGLGPAASFAAKKNSEIPGNRLLGGRDFRHIPGR
jgi:hypothetical protein